MNLAFNGNKPFDVERQGMPCLYQKNLIVELQWKITTIYQKRWKVEIFHKSLKFNDIINYSCF